MPADIHEKALAALSRRALTAGELRQKLQRAGFEPADIEAEIERLGRVRLLDDRAVAYNLARRSADQGRHGPARVRATLRARGVAPDLVDEAVGEAFAAGAADEALERAFRKLTRGTGVPQARPDRDRLVRRLLRSGFPAARVLALLERAGVPADELPEGDGADREEDDNDAVE